MCFNRPNRQRGFSRLERLSPYKELVRQGESIELAVKVDSVGSGLPVTSVQLIPGKDATEKRTAAQKDRDDLWKALDEDDEFNALPLFYKLHPDSLRDPDKPPTIEEMRIKSGYYQVRSKKG